MNNQLLKVQVMAGEMVQSLRVLAILAEDLRPVPAPTSGSSYYIELKLKPSGGGAHL